MALGEEFPLLMLLKTKQKKYEQGGKTAQHNSLMESLPSTGVNLLSALCSVIMQKLSSDVLKGILQEH